MGFAVHLLAFAVFIAAIAFGPELFGRPRVFNFSAGPASLPLRSLMRVRSEFLDYQGKGAGIFEMSHRDADGPVQTMMTRAASDLRTLLNVPPEFEVLHMHGGAHGQFAAVPLNLCTANQTGVYVVTGFWSDRAADEGAKQRSAVKVTGAKDGVLLDPSKWDYKAENPCFVHFCASETIDGIEFLQDPVVPSHLADVPLVGDFTSTLLSRPIDFKRFGVIYASGGKNLGPSGFVVVIVRKSLLGRASPNTPSILSWTASANSKPIPSIYNTPPVFDIYVHGVIMQQYIEEGGMQRLAARAKERSQRVYSLIDASKFYHNPIPAASRSVMSIPITIVVGGSRREDLEKRFVAESTVSGLIQLFGHPVRGGLRVTLYFGVPDDAVDSLLKFMNKFQLENGNSSSARK